MHSRSPDLAIRIFTPARRHSGPYPQAYPGIFRIQIRLFSCSCSHASDHVQADAELPPQSRPRRRSRQSEAIEVSSKRALTISPLACPPLRPLSLGPPQLPHLLLLRAPSLLHENPLPLLLLQQPPRPLPSRRDRLLRLLLLPCPPLPDSPTSPPSLPTRTASHQSARLTSPSSWPPQANSATDGTRPRLRQTPAPRPEEASKTAWRLSKAAVLPPRPVPLCLVGRS